MPKIEVIKQQDLSDCGACSLLCIIKYYGGYVPIAKIRDDTNTTASGVSAYNLIETAKSYGFEALGVKLEDLNNKNIYYPAIAHLTLKNGLNHFVVLYKTNSNYVWLMDPAKGKVKMTKAEFIEIWDNILILLTPSTKIIKFDKNLRLSSLIFKLVMQNKNLFLKICFINVIVMFFTILTSFYFQIIVSSINQGEDTLVIKTILAIFTLIYFFKVFLNFTKNYYLIYFHKNLDVTLFTDFLNHIFNLPLKFLQNRSTGEIISRVENLSEVKDLLAEVFTNILLNVILFGGALVVLYSINSKLFFLLCLVIIIYIVVGVTFSKLIYHKIKDNIATSTAFNSTLIENIEACTSIKNLGLTKTFIKYLESKLVKMFRSNFKTESLLNKISFIKDFLYEMGIFLIISTGILMIYKGEIELLSIITFQSLIYYLFNPIQDLINSLPKYYYLKATFSKLSEFLNVEEEKDKEGINTLKDYSIEFKDVSFSYNLTPILSHISFKISSGEKVFLKGPSGSGKSTICNLLLFRNSINNGTIRLGENNLVDYSLSTTLKTILYVGQHEKLLTGTIRENIICFRDILDEEFIKVTKICRIEEIVAKRKNRYETVLNAMQNNLSGGELQRLILARALLNPARIIILDEALSEVNYDLELAIIDDIKKYYPKHTLIYISHKDVSVKFTRTLDIGELNGQIVSE